MSAASDGIVIDAAIARGDASLEIELALQNTTPDPIYAFWLVHNGIGEDGVYRVEPTGYDLTVAGQRIVLSKKLMPVPPGMLVETQRIPFVVRVDGQTQIADRLSVTLPAREHGPYLIPPDENEEREKEIRSFELFIELGYFFAQPGTDALLKRYKTDKGLASGFMPFGIGSQRIARAGPFGAIPVLRPGRLIQRPS